VTPKVTLAMPESIWSALHDHLLATPARGEQAAFLFARDSMTEVGIRLDVVDAVHVAAPSIETQADDYIALSDGLRAALIRRAHELGAGLVEAHSHLGPVPACFSSYDLAGLGEWVPHIRWRTGARPYVALVFTVTGYDALAWVGTSTIPTSLSEVVAGTATVHPTDLTIGLLEEKHHEEP
jgi:hypothetical protein